MDTEFFKHMSRHIFGAAPSDTPNNCVRCKQLFSPTNLRTPAEQKESKLSGLCGICWDELFKEVEVPTMSVQMLNVAKQYEERLARLTAAITSPTVEKLLDVLECHGCSFEIGIDKELRAWTITIKEKQHEAVATALCELNPSKVAMTVKSDIKEAWYGFIFEITELPGGMAMIIGLRTEDNDDLASTPTPQQAH